MRCTSASDKPPALPPPPVPPQPQPVQAARLRQPDLRASRMKQGPDQIALPLDWPQSDGDARFIVSDANREAFEHFRKFSLWPVKATILTGPARSGRTLLARSFVERVGGRLSTRPTARRGRAVPRLEPGAGHRPAIGDDRRRDSAGLVAEAAGPEDAPCGDSGNPYRPSRRRSCSRRLIQLYFADRGLHIPADALRFMSRPVAPRLLDGGAGRRGGRSLCNRGARAAFAPDDSPRAYGSADDRRGCLASTCT